MKTDIEDDPVKEGACAILGIPLIFVLVIWQAFCVRTLWVWFVQYPAPTFQTVVGALFIWAVVKNSNSPDKKMSEYFYKMCVGGLALGILMLGAWIVKLIVVKG